MCAYVSCAVSQQLMFLLSIFFSYFFFSSFSWCFFCCCLNWLCEIVCACVWMYAVSNSIFSRSLLIMFVHVICVTLYALRAVLSFFSIFVYLISFIFLVFLFFTSSSSSSWNWSLFSHSLSLVFVYALLHSVWNIIFCSANTNSFVIMRKVYVEAVKVWTSRIFHKTLTENFNTVCYK